VISKNVFLVMPTYGSVPPEVHQSVMTAVMYASYWGVKWRGQAGTDRESWSAARSMPVDAVRKYADDCPLDGLIWCDSDMKFPKDAFARLVDSDKDLISGVYFQRKPPYWPNIYKYNAKKRGFERYLDYPPNVIAPIGGFGFGICYTSMDLLRAMPESPFKFGEFSEDLGFCRMAEERGFTPYADTGIECDHLIGNRWSNKKLFEKYRRILVDGGTGYGQLLGGEQEDVRGVHPVDEERTPGPVA
jgi:hypothetical protein